MLNYWWVTRPKRKLSAVADILPLVAGEALGQEWKAHTDTHISFEEALEKSGLKRKGERRDQGGSGGRTYTAWLFSLGLVFTQSSTNCLYLTLAGEAIMKGDSPVKVLKEQVLKYQFPSAFSLLQNVNMNKRFQIHPFWVMLKLMMDSRINYLTKQEIGRILATEAENESDKCYEYLVSRILQYRDIGESCLPKDFAERYKSTRSEVDYKKTLDKLDDIGNTMMNWLEFTQLIFRERGKMSILDDKKDEVKQIINNQLPFISKPEDHEYFQRRYGLDPKHRKDTRNLSNAKTVTPMMIATHKIKQAFIAQSIKTPIGKITTGLIEIIAEKTGIMQNVVSDVLHKEFPHGAIGGFMMNYFEMAFKGHDECREFENATAEIFKNVFGFDTKWLGSAYSGQQVPDVLLVSESSGYQAIIDTKAYKKYDLPTTQRDRMIHHYLPDISQYGRSNLPTSFFSYIAGGFSNTIATPLKEIASETGVNGSAMPVATFIKMAEYHAEHPMSHEKIASVFSVNRKVELTDFETDELMLVADNHTKYD